MDELLEQARQHEGAAQVQLISRLRREEPETVKGILRHFKSGDKFAAELLVRTFYPYAENLLVALESRSPHNRMSSQNSVAPSLTVAGSPRAEILNDFFARLIKDAADIDLRSGIKLYIFRSFMDSFARRMRSFSSKEALEAVKSSAKSSSERKDAETDGKMSDSFEAMFSYDTFTETPVEQTDGLSKAAAGFPDAAGKREKKRITGIPASRPADTAKAGLRNEPAAPSRSKAEESRRPVKEPVSAAPARSIPAAQEQQKTPKAAQPAVPRAVNQTANSAYTRWQAKNSRKSFASAAKSSSESLPAANRNNAKTKKEQSAAESSTEAVSAPRLLRQNKAAALAGSISKNGASKVMRPSEDMKIHAALQDKGGKVNLAPSLPDSRSVEYADYRDFSDEEIRASLSGKAKYVLTALNSLASGDPEAYRYVVMRYFAGRTFAQLSQDFEVKSSADIGMRLLRGLKAIIKNTPLT